MSESSAAPVWRVRPEVEDTLTKRILLKDPESYRVLFDLSLDEARDLQTKIGRAIREATNG